MQNEITRYIINGLLATFVHYAVLTFNMEVLLISSAGTANFIAAIFGISVSFIGNRYYVYQEHTGTIGSHFYKFILLYGFIAALHGIVLFVWTDINQFNYHTGFLLSTFLQVSLSYIGNKKLVFK